MATADIFAAEGDTWFLIWAGVLVFFMQAGFGMLEAGAVRAKNTKNILLKNLLDASLGAIVWYLIGYGFAYGDSTDGGFIGTGFSGFAIHSADWESSYTARGYDWAGWFFQYTFAAAAATIVSGGVAERCNLVAYLIYSVVITGFIYPVVVHWIWDSEGFLSAFSSSPLLGGCIDFAGSGVVHMTGGVAALVGAAILGPRIGRFADGKPVPMPGHNSVLSVLGTFILWVGWYGFNGGSTLGVFVYEYGRDLARVCVTTTLSAAACGLVVVLTTYFMSHVWDVGAVCNGVLAGLVSITAGCVVMDPWASIITGILGAFVYIGASKLLLKLKIDDPLDAFAVHGAAGFWGVLAVGIFCRPEYSYNLEGSHGFVYPGPKPDLIVVQLLALVIEVGWVSILSGIMFGILKVTGLFRVSPEIEEAGMDVSKHGGGAYDLTSGKLAA